MSLNIDVHDIVAVYETETAVGSYILKYSPISADLYDISYVLGPSLLARTGGRAKRPSEHETTEE